MKKIPDPLSTLLIRPPFIPTAPPSKAWTRILSELKSIQPDVRICDTALDFIENDLATIENLNHMMERVDALGQNGTLKDAEQDSTHRFRQGYTSAASIQELSSQIVSLINRLAAPDPTDVVGTCRDLTKMDAFLDLVSAAYHPCQFHHQGFAYKGLSTSEGLAQFTKNAKINPFWRYAFNQWQPISSVEPPALALLFVEQPGHIGPAATMISAWQKRWPEVPLHIIGPRRLTKVCIENLSAGSISQVPPELTACIDTIDQVVADLFPEIPKAIKGDTHVPAPYMLPLSQSLEHEQMPTIVQNAINNHDPLIIWRPCGDAIELVTQQLYKASRQGMWNHLVFTDPIPTELEKFAAANANIVHSYCYQDRAVSTFSDPVFRYPKASLNYGQTKPLPGRPLWMALQNTTLIEMLLTHFDRNSLIRLRVRDHDQSVFEVGKDITYHYRPPGDLPKGHLGEIVNMVAAGGSVNTTFVRQNLERAYLIAYVEEEGVIIGNSCLKRPREEYIDVVSQQSGIDLHDYLERGYTSVRPDYRGLGVGAKLLEGLTERAGDHKIFSVIAEANIATQKMAIRNRTRRVATFFSERAQKEMSVWIPEWMIPEGIVLPAQPEIKDNHQTGKDDS